MSAAAAQDEGALAATTPLHLATGHGVVHLTLNVPGTRNALSARVVEELHRGVTTAENGAAAALVLRASGPVFSAGFDLTDVQNESDAVLRGRFLEIQRLLDRLRQAPFATACVVEGPAVGAGADLAAACDYRTGTRSASFRFPGPGVGLILGTGRAARILGSTAALDVLARRRTLDADTAHALGLLGLVDEPAALEARIAELGRSLADLGTVTVQLLLEQLRVPYESGTEALAASLAGPGLGQRLQDMARRGHQLSAERPYAAGSTGVGTEDEVERT